MKINRIWLAIIILALAMVACVTSATIPTLTPETQPSPDMLPTLPVPTVITEVVYNQNTELVLDNCERKSYTTTQTGRIYYNHCTPKDYKIYSLACNAHQVGINYTGESYSFLLGGHCGSHGFEFNAYLPATCSAIDIHGIRDISGPENQYSMQGTIGLAGGSGIVHLNINPILGNGEYLTQFYIRTNRPDTYTIRVYFVFPNPDSDIRSYATINSIVTHPVPSGHCDGAPSI